MSIKINGQPFDFDSDTLFSGDDLDDTSPLLHFILFVEIAFIAIQLHPWIVKLFQSLFSLLMKGVFLV